MCKPKFWLSNKNDKLISNHLRIWAKKQPTNLLGKNTKKEFLAPPF
jgi:hypothetical protein